MIESETSSVSYSGNNSTTTAYVINFPFLAPGDLVVTVTDAGGTITTLTDGTDYTLFGTWSADGARYTGGSLLTAAAYSSANTVAIKRVTPVTQPTSYTDTGQFPAESHETALDRLTMIAQETRRDSAPAASNVEASGNGLIAQTVAGTFSARTISPAGGSGLAVTNGNGVGGNPTIDTDFSGFPVVTSLSASDLIPVRASGVESAITRANLQTDLLSATYGTIEIIGREIVPKPSGGCTMVTASYATASEIIAQFPNSAAAIGYFRFILPGDYSGGVVKMRLYQLDGASGADTGNVVWSTRASLGTAAGGSYVETVSTGLTGFNVYVIGSPITLGTGWSAGYPIIVEILREPAHGSDTKANDVFLSGIQIQYPKTALITAWT